MAVNLSDLVPSLQREVNPPGGSLYTLTDDVWVGHLADAFWEARLQGLLSNYTESNGVITPQSGTKDLPRELQQLIVLFAGFRLALNSFQNVNSSYRAKAGPVEYEVQKSAQTLRGVLDALRARIKVVTDVLADQGSTNAVMFDAVVESGYSIAARETWFVR